MLDPDLRHTLAALAEEDLGLGGALIDRTWDIMKERADRYELESLLDPGTTTEAVNRTRKAFETALEAAIEEYAEDHGTFWAKSGHLE